MLHKARWRCDGFHRPRVSASAMSRKLSERERSEISERDVRERDADGANNVLIAVERDLISISQYFRKWSDMAFKVVRYAFQY